MACLTEPYTDKQCEGRGTAGFHQSPPGHTTSRARQQHTPIKSALCTNPRCLANVVSAVVYLKNRVIRAWQPNDDASAQKPIPEEDKLDLRNRLLPILASSLPQIRSQLIPILQKILSYDFPAKWPNFLDITLQLLNTNDANSAFGGLHCMLAICRMYRFKGGDTRPEFNQIVEASFPQLWAIATRLVDETGVEAWEMLHIIMKAYKHAIYVSKPRALQDSHHTDAFQVRIITSFNGSKPDGRLVYVILKYCQQRSSSPCS